MLKSWLTKSAFTEGRLDGTVGLAPFWPGVVTVTWRGRVGSPAKEEELPFFSCKHEKKNNVLVKKLESN